MSIKRLEITNFCGFERLEMNFEEKLTVLAGVNGIGKSSLTKALARMLSICLPDFSYSHQPVINFDYDDIMFGKNSLELILQIYSKENKLTFKENVTKKIITFTNKLNSFKLGEKEIISELLDKKYIIEIKNNKSNESEKDKYIINKLPDDFKSFKIHERYRNIKKKLFTFLCKKRNTNFIESALEFLNFNNTYLLANLKQERYDENQNKYSYLTDPPKQAITQKPDSNKEKHTYKNILSSAGRKISYSTDLELDKIFDPIKEDIKRAIIELVRASRDIEKFSGNNIPKSLCLDPVFAVLYTTSRSQFKNKPSKLSELDYGNIERAYFSALDGELQGLKEFIGWYNIHNNIGIERIKIKKLIENAILTFLEDYTKLFITEEDKPAMFLEKNNTILNVNQMSDGEKSLLSMVIDLARRLAIANPNSDNPLKDGKAIVLIDEIELHLHPGWQRTIIHRLLDTFPNCQFIMTTHSPQVLGEVEAKNVRILYKSEETKRVEFFIPPQTIGLDSSELLEELMETPRRNQNLSETFSAISDMISSLNFHKAQESIDYLREEYGSIPELVKLQTELDFETTDKDFEDEED